MNKLKYAIVPAFATAFSAPAFAQTAGGTMDISSPVGGLITSIGTNGLAVAGVVVALVGVAIGLTMLTRAKKGA